MPRGEGSVSSSRSGAASWGGRERTGDDEGVSVDEDEGWGGVGDGGVEVERGFPGKVTTVGWFEPTAETSSMGASCTLKGPVEFATGGTTATATRGDGAVVGSWGSAGVATVGAEGGAATLDARREVWGG